MKQSLKALVLFMGIMWLSLVVPTSSAETIHFAGSGQTTTLPFTIRDGWEIQWGSSKAIQVNVYKKGNSIKEKFLLVNSPTGGSGKSIHPNPGKFFLDIRSFGDWSVDIVELPQDMR